MKTLKLAGCLVGAIVFNTISGSVCADSFPEKAGYLIDERGNVVRNSYGECWRTGYWTPAMAIAECDSDVPKKLDVAQKKEQHDEELREARSLPIPAPAPAPAPTSVAAHTAEPDPVPEKQAAVQEKPTVIASFKAETLFDFDKAVIKSEGKKILEEDIATGMKMHPEVKLLLVTGHADRIGKKIYNQKLSEHRANAVKAYLVKNGVAAERIKAVGKGESEPNPEANTKQACKGVRGGKLIACLQPDRRVTIESESR